MVLPPNRWLRIALLLGVYSSLSACYYLQAVRGQLEILCKREPIAEVLADTATPEEVAMRLRLVQDARDFSIEALGMPDNDTYRSYADLERDYAVWSIFAAPELSLDALNWCYPVVGCVAYRGSFRHERAIEEAQDLESRGFDVYVGGVPAYSTLGRFDDPVLNTMLRWDDLQLVGTVFHELAHQVLYIADDTAFNESFATAVEEIGVERFLSRRGSDAGLALYRQRQLQRNAMRELVGNARDDLERYYTETLDDDEKRLLKEHRLEQLSADLRALFTVPAGLPANDFFMPWNNARLLSFSLYAGWVPAFQRMYTDCGRDIECFYAEAIRVSQLERAGRERYLEVLATRSAGTGGATAANSSLSRRVSPLSRQ
jgi:predicted aminopeptidase